MVRECDLREFYRRIFGWAEERAGLVEDAVHALLDAVTRGTPIALRGESDLVPVAHALHRRLFGSDRPFVVCDPRRREGDGSVRSPPNRRTGMLALEAAMGGSVCLRSRRLPTDFDELAASLQGSVPATTLFVCLDDDDRIRDLLCRPLEIPSLVQRASDLDRLLDAYLEEAAQALLVRSVQLSQRLRRSLFRHVISLTELEKAALRLVALKSTPNMTQAALRLEMAPVSLSRWLDRRPWVAAYLDNAEERDDGADEDR
jgi:hypothetical protein